MNLSTILAETFFNNTILQWGTALIVTCVVLASVWILKAYVVRRLRKFSERTKTDLDDLIVDLLGSTKFLLVFGISLYVGSTVLVLPDTTRLIITKAAVFLFLLQVALWGNYFINFSDIDMVIKGFQGVAYPVPAADCHTIANCPLGAEAPCLP